MGLNLIKPIPFYFIILGIRICFEYFNWANLHYMKINFISILCVLFLCQELKAQEFIPGDTYFDDNEFVEYFAGNLPIVISVPHGGYLEPSNIPDRNCTGCVYVRDSYTQELAREYQGAMTDETGCFPHVVINLLHRKKFDANRAIIEAADGNSTVEASWIAYHEFLDKAKLKVLEDYEKGLFLDFHGHGHDIQRIELGYLLNKSTLQLDDEELNLDLNISESSLRSLVSNNNQLYDHATLIRGEESFGALLDDSGFPSVPSFEIPYPESNEPYFRGGYNTQRHGSRSGGAIDGIQIECNSSIRFDNNTRKRFADSLSLITLQYIDVHYFASFHQGFCSLVSNDALVEKEHEFQIYPNPFEDFVYLKTDLEKLQLVVFDIYGIEWIRKEWKGQGLSLGELPKGIYFIQVLDDGLHLTTKSLIKH